MPERVVTLAAEVGRITAARVAQIREITRHTRTLSLNAQMEAARAGEAGKGFAIVAGEVRAISKEINTLSESLTHELSARTRELEELGRSLVARVRGARLADLALGAADVLDRTLYERSCDVRWWATEPALVEACARPSPEASAQAGRRLSVILDSYTVYLELCLADADGRVLAQGRPGRFPGLVGADVSGEAWFRQGLGTADGSRYFGAPIRHDPDLRAPAATFSTAVRAGGDAGGRPIGVLGVHFDWAAQARLLLEGVRLAPEEVPFTTCRLVDAQGRVLACSRADVDLKGAAPPARADLPPPGAPPGWRADPAGGVVAWAASPGFMEYPGAGLWSLIEQRPPPSAAASAAAAR